MKMMVMHMETAANRYTSASHHPEKMIHSHTRTWNDHETISCNEALTEPPLRQPTQRGGMTRIRQIEESCFHDGLLSDRAGSLPLHNANRASHSEVGSVKIAVVNSNAL